MQRLFPLVALAVSASIGAFGSARPSVEGARALRHMPNALCIDSSGVVAEMIAHLADFATTTDSLKLAMRSGASLGPVLATDVVLVSDTTLCRRASEVFRHARFNTDTGPLLQVYLIRYGTSRYVGSTLELAGEWTPWTVFDTSFVPIVAITH